MCPSSGLNGMTTSEESRMERPEFASVIILHAFLILYYTCTISLKGRDNVRCIGLPHSYFTDVDYLVK
jgi:hypothetical protein